MEDAPKVTKSNGFFRFFAKGPTVRIFLPIIVSVHLGWYYLRGHMVYDEKEHFYVYKANPEKV